MGILDLGLKEAMRAVTRLRYFFIGSSNAYTKYYAITQRLAKNLAPTQSLLSIEFTEIKCGASILFSNI
jgi:hypothetical protein